MDPHLYTRLHEYPEDLDLVHARGVPCHPK